jgi:hypothetical protein
VPVSVADLAKYYADTSPPKNDSLANLEARLEALSSPSYRSPFTFEPSSLPPPAALAFGPYASVGDTLKPPTVPDVASLYPLHRTIGLTTPGATTVSELFAQRYGAPSSSLRQQLAETRGLVTGSSGIGRFLYTSEGAIGGALETLRLQLKKFGLFAGGLAAGLEKTLNALRGVRPLDPYGNPVPLHNVWLYVLASRAYRGDYVARAAFLDEIGADESADNVYHLDGLLRPTFDSAPQDLGGRRCAWEQLAPEKARRQLLRRLRDLKDEDGRVRGVILPWEDEQGEEPAGEEDLALFALEENELHQARQEKLRSAFNALPERRLQVAKFRAEGLTAEQIGMQLGISSSSVRTHMQHLRQDETLRRLRRQ